MSQTAEMKSLAQGFIAGLSKTLKEQSAKMSPMELARLAGIAFQQTFSSGSREDKLTNAMARGLSVREKMAASEGGSLSAEEAARQLDLTKQSVLNLYHAGKLLGWRTEKQRAVRFPAWQFDGGRRLPGLEQVLARLSAASSLDDWAKIGFFLQTHRMLDNRRPLDLLREGNLNAVLKAADAYAG